MTLLNKLLLITNLSDALLDLLVVDGSIVDGVELGSWLSLEQISKYRRKFPDLPFLFHGSNMIVEIGEDLGVEKSILNYLACTGSPWISVHLMVWKVGELERLLGGERLPLPDPGEALERLLGRIERLKRLVAIPVLIENIEPLPLDGYDFWSHPEYIRQVLERSDCGFLLDTGHLRVSADRLGMDVETYLGQLPLERMVEVHVSGPRRRGGQLLDLHEPMQALDLQLLEELLSRQVPQAVTLEYIRDREQLSKQLYRLRRLLGLDSSRFERSIG